MPAVSTSTPRGSAWSAVTSGTSAGCSSGSPPVTTTFCGPASFTLRSTLSSVSSLPRPASQEYFVSHHAQPTEQPWRRTKTDGVPTDGPSPWIELNTSLTRSVASCLTALWSHAQPQVDGDHDPLYTSAVRRGGRIPENRVRPGTPR